MTKLVMWNPDAPEWDRGEQPEVTIRAYISGTWFFDIEPNDTSALAWEMTREALEYEFTELLISQVKAMETIL